MCSLLDVHLLVVYLHSVQVHTSSKNVLAVAMDLVATHLLGVHLLLVYLNSTHIQTSSRDVLAVALDLLGVTYYTCTCKVCTY